MSECDSCGAEYARVLLDTFEKLGSGGCPDCNPLEHLDLDDGGSANARVHKSTAPSYMPKGKAD